jgi:Mce-associated membrane protein
MTRTANRLEIPMGVDTHSVVQDHTDTAADSGAIDVVEAIDDTEGSAAADAADEADHAKKRRIRLRIGSISWTRLLAYAILPGSALILALIAGYLRWQDTTARESQTAAKQSAQAAIESTIALLSYSPDTVEKDLTAARARLTGSFRDSYTGLTNDVVIPGAQQKHIAARATVPAAAPVSANESHAVVLVFVDQTVTIGTDAPSDTASSVRVTLDRIDNRWLISGFDPV